MRAPWEFSTPPDAGPGIPNVPSDQGRELGGYISNFVDVEEDRLRRKGGDPPARCNDCAGLAGTTPNSCAVTLMDLIKCVAEETPFFCHKGVPDGEEPDVLCRAFLALVSDDFKDRLRRTIEEAQPVRPLGRTRITRSLFGAALTITAASFFAHGGRR